MWYDEIKTRNIMKKLKQLIPINKEGYSIIGLSAAFTVVSLYFCPIVVSLINIVGFVSSLIFFRDPKRKITNQHT